jgi:hypothetical protein
MFDDPATLAVQIDPIVEPAHFTQTNDCPATLPGDSLEGNACTVRVTFAPPAADDESMARLRLGTTEVPPLAPRFVNLYARSVAAPKPALSNPPAPGKRRCVKRKRAGGKRAGGKHAKRGTRGKHSRPKRCRKRRARR